MNDAEKLILVGRKTGVCCRPDCDKQTTNEPTFGIADAQIGPYCEEHWKIFSQGFNKAIEDCFTTPQEKWRQFYEAFLAGVSSASPKDSSLIEEEEEMKMKEAE